MTDLHEDEQLKGMFTVTPLAPIKHDGTEPVIYEVDHVEFNNGTVEIHLKGQKVQNPETTLSLEQLANKQNSLRE